MNPQEIEIIKEEFDERFFRLKFGDGSAAGGGKGAYLIPKENLSFDEIKDFFISHINELLKVRGEKIYQDCVDICIDKMDEARDLNKNNMFQTALDIKNEIINLIQSDLSTNPSSQDEEK